MLTAAIAMSCLAALISVALGLIAVRLGTPNKDLVEKVNDLLAHPADDFDRAAKLVLEKNRELYRRLS